MRTGANFARGSCRALKWMALLAVVLAVAASDALAQSKPTWELSVSDKLAEGESLVPVKVRLTVDAVDAGTRDHTVTIVVSVAQLTEAELNGWMSQTEEVLNAMHPIPITRAELGTDPPRALRPKILP